MNSLRDSSLVALLPESLKKDSFIKALAEAVEIQLKEAYAEAETLSLLTDVENISEELLDFLAFQRNVNFYDSSLPLETKRKLVQKGVYLHQIKGTPAAVEELISTLFGQGRVIEWFEYGGEPFYFKVRTNNFTVVGDQTEKFIKSLESVKNKRSRLEIVEFEQIYSGDLEVRSEYTTFQYPFQAFASQDTICGVWYDGELIVPENQSVSYESSLEFSSVYNNNLQSSVKFTNEVFAGQGGTNY